MPLWVVATPIGTLSDLSPRAREVLTGASIILAEDTRVARRLLSALEIAAPRLESLHAHNEYSRASAFAERAVHEDVVLVSDAGTPTISDPGGLLVAAAHEAGAAVRLVPGPSAVAGALSVAGFSSTPSTFLGFPPRKGRKGWIKRALARPETLVMFESPRRVVSLLKALANEDPVRQACLCRELTKVYEEVVRSPLEVLAVELAQRSSVRGECVIVVGPTAAKGREQSAPPAVEPGAPLRDIAAVLSFRWGVSRAVAYRRLVTMEDSFDDPES